MKRDTPAIMTKLHSQINATWIIKTMIIIPVRKIGTETSVYSRSFKHSNISDHYNQKYDGRCRYQITQKCNKWISMVAYTYSERSSVRPWKLFSMAIPLGVNPSLLGNLRASSLPGLSNKKPASLSNCSRAQKWNNVSFGSGSEILTRQYYVSTC